MASSSLNLATMQDIVPDAGLSHQKVPETKMAITAFTMRKNGSPGLAFWLISGQYTYGMSQQTHGVSMQADYNAFYLREGQLPRHIIDGIYTLALKDYGLIPGWYVFPEQAPGAVNNRRTAGQNLLAFAADAKQKKFGDRLNFEITNVEITKSIYETIVNCIHEKKDVIDLTSEAGLLMSPPVPLEYFDQALPEPTLRGPAVLRGEPPKRAASSGSEHEDKDEHGSAPDEAIARAVSLDAPSTPPRSTATSTSTRKRGPVPDMPPTPRKRRATEAASASDAALL